MKRGLVALTVLAAILAPAAAHPGPPVARVPFSTVVPLPTGHYYFRFSLWDTNGVSAPGTMVWSEQKRIPVVGELVGATYRAPLSHVLGSVNPFATPAKPPYPAVDFS
ncbi:MAG TPA: hypothetical protein VN317_09470, partial [Candidatus Methanoperedens sp.]|nr:hypothetical protein [Candidatus Methanoperedens sp.]